MIGYINPMHSSFLVTFNVLAELHVSSPRHHKSIIEENAKARDGGEKKSVHLSMIPPPHAYRHLGDQTSKKAKLIATLPASSRYLQRPFLFSRSRQEIERGEWKWNGISCYLSNRYYFVTVLGHPCIPCTPCKCRKLSSRTRKDVLLTSV
ncbi:hypothetical protein M431DRAFT_292562 [Trichoderma harzianum CBS 226.95]|uniref:Uncharacterized protein n=1 Tax=Trichoderma harzianum CBS 226.95 TaxID=983964 RepID=A0A2T4APJ5_TRIHA|nr:hypothetical protein M431DRAFT_292562 [Trichoderma harzianum CBS 226.95]PTB58993.1 hypothetical protein M431DRAFT_292562 [Trichoderma harzianum CBS 226.95]